MDLEVNQKKLQEIQKRFWPEKIQQMLNNSIKKVVVLLNRYAIEETPTDQWLLRNSFHSEFRPSFWRLFNNSEYAIFVHEGTRPHSAPFTPIAEWAERHWLNPWSVWLAIRRKWTKANPFMERAVERADDEVDKIFQREIDAMIEIIVK